jgi:two-component system, cell cycle sensor histidine kinase and response regulator CckA
MAENPTYEKLVRRVQELEKAESQRNITEDRLKKIFDNTQDAIFIHDLEGKILDVNDKMCRMYGLTKEEALEVNIEDVSSSKMAMDVLLERWQKVLNGEKFLFEWEARRPKDESVFNVEVSIQKISFHDKDIVLANIRDITERKRAEEALRESRDILEKKSEEQRLLLDGIKTQVWYLSDVGTYGRVNRAHADFLGFHPRKIAYKRLETFLSMDVAAVCKQSNQAVFETRAPVHTEEWVPNALGEARLLEITKVPKLNEDSSVAFVVCTAADITDRKQAETRNSYQLGLITSLMNSIPDLVFYKNLDGEYLGCNNEFACHVGSTPDQVVGKTDYDLYPEKEADAFRANDKKMLDIGSPRHNEEWVRYPDGRQMLLDTLKAPLRSMDGELIGSIGISRDITRRKHLEAKIRYLRKTESLGRMAGAVAHHYNNMLSVVSGYLELAIDDLAGGAGAGNNLSAALKATQRASKMGHVMLAVLGKTEPAYRQVDLSMVCRDHLTEFQKNAINDVILETDLPDPGPGVKTNTKQVQQIIENLVANALESMADLPRPVPVRVHIKTVPPDSIQSLHRYPVDFQAAADLYACLEITDLGHGIPEKDIENIFDPFYSSKFIGRGLGLSLTLAIVKAHEGCVTVECHEKGSVFRVFLPVKQPAS